MTNSYVYICVCMFVFLSIYNIIESEMIEIVKKDKSIFVLNENSLFYEKNY